MTAFLQRFGAYLLQVSIRAFLLRFRAYLLQASIRAFSSGEMAW